MPKASQSDRPRACTNCAQAKTKCSWPSNTNGGEQICQRCSKYNLQCSVSHPKPIPKRGKSTQTKTIEHKIDHILSLLIRNDEHSCRPGQAILSRQQSTNHSSTTSTASCPGVEILPGFQLTYEEANQTLQHYMAAMVPQFPFVPLPNCNAHDMYKDKPLLLKTILMACRPEPGFCAAFNEWFRQSIAYTTVVRMKKNVEILQAILVFLAWNDVSFYASGHDTSLVQLALGVVGDMKLCEPTEMSNTRSIAEDAARLRSDLPQRTQHTSADRRAVLGVFYITSVLSTLLGKSSQLDYTPYLDQCCRKLVLNQEFSTDSLLAQLINVQKIASKTDKTCRAKMDMTSDTTISCMSIKIIEKELSTLMQHLPRSLENNTLVYSHYAATRIRLFESVMHGHQSDSFEPTNFRSDFLWNCLKNTNVLIDKYLSLSIETFPTLAFTSMLHLALAIIKATQLLLKEDHNWDTDMARASIDLGDLLQKLSDRFDAVHELGLPRCGILLDGRPFFATHARNFRWMREGYLAKSGLGNTVYVNSSFMEPLFGQYFEQNDGVEFWQQLADLNSGVMF